MVECSIREADVTLRTRIGGESDESCQKQHVHDADFAQMFADCFQGVWGVPIMNLVAVATRAASIRESHSTLFQTAFYPLAAAFATLDRSS